MDPESPFILVEQLAQARDHTTWPTLMEPALAPLRCRVSQSSSEEWPGLLASVEHDLPAHHAPDVLHVPHELGKAVSGPRAIKARAAYKAVTEATERLEGRKSAPTNAGDAPAERRPGRPPQTPGSLAHTAHALEGARRAHARLAQQREQVQASLRDIGHDDPCVDLERGVRRNGPRIAADIPEDLEQMRAVAQHEGLSQRCVARLEKAERVVPTMPAPSECVSRDVGPQVTQHAVTPPVSWAMQAKLLPSSDLDRVAATRTGSAGAPLRELAERLRAPWFAPGGLLSGLSPETHHHLQDEAKRLATVFQRSSAKVEGRNSSLSLRSHQLRGLDLPRKREGFTALPNFFLTRPDGTTAAERFFGQKPHAMFAVILASEELPPAPLRPPRRAEGGRRRVAPSKPRRGGWRVDA